MQPKVSSETSPTSLFLIRGNKVQLYNFQTGEVLRETQMECNPELFELKGHLSFDKLTYVVYSTNEVALFNLSGNVVAREADKNICKAKFIDHSNRYFCKISKQGTTYVITLSIWDGQELKKLERFEANFFKVNYEYVRFDRQGEVLAVQTKPTEIDLFLEHDSKLNHRYKIEIPTQIVDFYVRPGLAFLIADDLKDGKATISVSVYRLLDKPVLDHKRVFNNVQEAKMHISDDGSVALVNAHRIMDTTGNCYYGLEIVFFYNQNNKIFDDVVSHKGSIHDVKLSHCQKNFVVVSGSVPSFTVLYDAKNNPLHMMSHDFRNQIFSAPNDAFVAIAGFGSLTGEIEIWNYQKKEFIGGCTSNFASFLKWSSDSAFFVTAVVIEKLKVDHRISIFSYNGTLLKKVNLDIPDLITVDFAFVRPSDQSIIEKPQKKPKPGVTHQVQDGAPKDRRRSHQKLRARGSTHGQGSGHQADADCRKQPCQ